MNISFLNLLILACALVLLTFLAHRLKLKVTISYVLSAFLIIFSIFIFLKRNGTVSSSEIANGTIIEILKSDLGEGGPTYCFRAKYTSKSGYEGVVSSSICSSSVKYQVGGSVDVIYNKSDPRKAAIYAVHELYFLPIFLGLMGVMLMALDIYNSVKIGRKPSANA